MDIITYAKSKTYTNETAEEFGGLKGANCTIKSITPITGGNTVTFEWKNSEGATQEGTLDVMDGVNGNDGLGIKSVTINASNHLIITYDDDTTEDAGEVQTVQGEDGKSAYEIAVEHGYSGTEEEWLASLKGEDGEEGFSPEITVKESTSERYVLTIKTKDDEFDTPNLKGGGSGSASRMSDLEDVQLTSLTTGQILKWNGSKWVNEDGVEIDSLGDINDVDLGTLTDGQVLSWDATNQKWVNKDAVNPTQFATMPSPASALSGIVYQYVGGSSQAFVKGRFYTCLYDNVNDNWYWDEIKYAADTDSALDPTSKNPVANDALCEEFDKKQDKDLETPIEVDGAEQTTVEDTLLALNTYAAKKVDQLNSLPVASADTLGMLVQYKGATTATLKHAFFYECKVVEGSDPAEYEWVDAGIGGEDLSQYKKIFSGTSAEWDALPLEDKITYDYIMPDDDGETGDIADVVESGNHNPVESDAVFDSEQTIYEVMGQMGAKNLIPYPHDAKTETKAGITFTENADGSITINGTATDIARHLISSQQFEVGKKYILSGCPSGGGHGSNGTYTLYTQTINNYDDGEGVEFTWNASITGITIAVYTGVTVDNLTFYPMLRLSSDTDDTYQLYAKTNQQLTAENGALTNAFTNYVNNNGSKNYSTNDQLTAKTSKGITYTPLGNGSFTVSASPSSDSIDFQIVGYANLKAGVTYILSGGLETNARLDLRVGDVGTSYTDNAENKTVTSPAVTNSIDTFTPNNDVTVIVGFRGNKNSTFSGTVYPMIRLATDTDPTYQPYAKTNRQLTEDSVDWDNFSELGAVNLLEVTATGTTTKTGGSGSVDFTVNADKSITINCDGTHTSDVYFSCAKVTVPKGSWKFSALQANSSMTYFMYLDSVTGITYDNRYDSGNGTRFTNSAEFSTTLTICVKAGTALNNVTIYPMIAPIDYNGDYVPYAKTNKELTQDSVNWDNFSEVGAVNHLKNNATTTTTTDGTTTFTWTVNDDKSVTVSAPSYPVTVASNQTLIPWDNISADECSYLVGKVFKLTGCPSGGSRDTYRVQIYRVMSADGSSGTAEEYGKGKTFTWSNNGSGTKAKVQMIISSGYTMTGPITFKPMLTDKHYNGPYVPYAKTNRELTEETDVTLTPDTSNFSIVSYKIKKRDGHVYGYIDAKVVNVSGISIGTLSEKPPYTWAQAACNSTHRAADNTPTICYVNNQGVIAINPANVFIVDDRIQIAIDFYT